MLVSRLLSSASCCQRYVIDKDEGSSSALELQLQRHIRGTRSEDRCHLLTVPDCSAVRRNSLAVDLHIIGIHLDIAPTGSSS